MNALVAVAKSSSPSIVADSLVRRFLAWAPRARAEERADAISALARAYLYCDMPAETRTEAAMALTAALDDVSVVVRRALAQALASAAEAPRHIVLALASDQSDVARVVLALSPLFEDDELVDCAAVGDAAAQTAIARRPRLGAAVSAALAEIGEAGAVIALLGNPRAEIGEAALGRMFERFCGEPAVREAMLGRTGLPAWLRAEIAKATAADLARMAADSVWLDPRRAERVARESCEQAFVAIALSCQEEELPAFVAWLRANKALTVGLLMRSLACADVSLLRRSLIDMSGLPPRRVAGLLRDWRGHGFPALYDKAGMPAHLLPAFKAAVALAEATQAQPGGDVDLGLTHLLIGELEAQRNPALAPVVALLWRLAGEAARARAREFALDAASPSIVDDGFDPAASERLQLAPVVRAIEEDAADMSVAPLIEHDLECQQAMARAA